MFFFNFEETGECLDDTPTPPVPYYDLDGWSRIAPRMTRHWDAVYQEAGQRMAFFAEAFLADNPALCAALKRKEDAMAAHGASEQRAPPDVRVLSTDDPTFGRSGDTESDSQWPLSPGDQRSTCAAPWCPQPAHTDGPLCACSMCLETLAKRGTQGPLSHL